MTKDLCDDAVVPRTRYQVQDARHNLRNGCMEKCKIACVSLYVDGDYGWDRGMGASCTVEDLVWEVEDGMCGGLQIVEMDMEGMRYQESTDKGIRDPKSSMTQHCMH